MIYVNEDLLVNENLPRDLAKAYQKIKTYQNQPSTSQRHPETYHKEIGFPNSSRRAIRYDYGHADYEEISKEEALRLIKQNKHNIESLRILLNGDLVEYEVRDNGSIYCIYCNKTNEFSTRDGRRYPNIAYAPYSKVIDLADKIYKTNEYEHPIVRSRNNSQELARIGSLKKRTADTRFTPGRAYYDNARVFARNLDTGAHDPRNAGNFDYDPLEFTSGIGDDYRRIPDRSNTLLQRYLERQYRISSKKKELSAISKTIEKLIKEKDEYTEEEYQDLYDQYSSIKDLYEQELRNLKKEQDRSQKENINHFYSSCFSLNQKIGQYLATSERFLTRAKSLSDQCNNYLQKTSANQSYSSESSRVKQLIKDIQVETTQLKDIEKQIEDQIIDRDSDSIQAHQQHLDDLISQLKSQKKEVFVRIKRSLKTYEDQLNQLENEFKQLEMEIKPRTAAKKARQAAADRGELDPNLTNIIDFTESE